MSLPTARLKEESARDVSMSSVSYRFRSRLQNLSLKALHKKSSQSALDVSFSPKELLSPGIVRERDPGPDAEAARMPTDPVEDQAILESIENVYYNNEVDTSRHELQKLPLTLDSHVIDGTRRRLLAQLTVVTKRAFGNILTQQPQCTKELDRVCQLHSQLGDALKLCRASRSGLSRARTEFTDSSLGLLSACRRRKRAQDLLEDLSLIRTLHRTDERLQELLGEGVDDFPGAITLLLEAKAAVVNFQHFQCVKSLAAKLQDTLEMAEEQLDVALARVCVNYNPVLYSRLAEAYRLLGKTQISMDQLGMHVTSAIHNTAWNVVFGHAMLNSQQGNRESDLSKKPYADLCACMDPSSILPCLVDLCRALWAIMNSYRSIVEWHKRHRQSRTTPSGDHEDQLEDHYIAKKLETGKMRIWQDVQTKARVLVLANDLSRLSIDAFLEFCDVIHRLIEVGNTFCDSVSDTLQESLKRQCWSYFHAYHLARLEELKMHLENEGWARCPVKPTFRARNLQEYRSFIGGVNDFARKTSSPRKASTHGESQTQHCPFDPNPADESIVDEDLLDSSKKHEDTSDAFFSGDESDSEVDEELKQDYIQEPGEEASSTQTTSPKRGSKCAAEGPILTNTSLLVLRLCGKYLHLMQDLEPIAASVFISMTQLIDFYVLSVYDFFTKDMPSEYLSRCLDRNLASVLERIRLDLIKRVVPTAAPQPPMASTPTKSGFPAMVDSPLKATFMSPIRNSPSKNSIQHEETTGHSSTPSPAHTTGIVSEPQLCPSVDLKIAEDLFAVSERYIAAESALYLISEFQSLQELVPTTGAHAKEYQEQTLAFLPHIQRPIYLGVGVGSINSEVILQLMSKVAWDIKEVRSQHSQYVEVMLRDFQIIVLRLSDIQSVLSIPLRVRKSIWEVSMFWAAQIFVEGFSSARHCSNEGRALMQLDFRQFVVKLEKLFAGELRPIPYQDFVVQYIKAYYIPEMDLESWVKQHNSEYTEKQLVALVNCVAYSNNRTKQKLNSLISDLSGRIRREKS